MNGWQARAGSGGAGAWFGLAGAGDAVAGRFGDAVVSGVALPCRLRDWGDRSGSDEAGAVLVADAPGARHLPGN